MNGLFFTLFEVNQKTFIISRDYWKNDKFIMKCDSGLIKISNANIYYNS